MLRLIHAQTVAGAILVDDIDDGLPNKEAYRLGRTANPKTYARDGAANVPKQACYVPYSHTTPTGSVVPGYINLNQTERVTFSAGKGKILGLYRAGLILAPVSLVAANIVAPLVASGTTTGGVGPVTAAGTTFTSVAPDISTVTFATGTGSTTPSPTTFTAAQILGAVGGVFTATNISVPASLFSVRPAVGNTITVNANEQNSNTFAYTT